MRAILVHLRAMQLFYHNAHNLAKGQMFFADHEQFADFYAAIEKDYDSVVERALPSMGDQILDMKQLLNDIYKIIKDSPSFNASSNSVFFNYAMQMEKELIKLCEKEIPGKSQGTVQLLGNICDFSEARQYLISRRLK